MNSLLLLAALPMGDDTPILLYAVLGIVAVLLLVGSVILGKKSKNNDKDKK
ncbi:MAG: LPXTG cell wall anchor domain-containing protein [Oscillospiraceae bacterium]|nr:LPXTG cell wall anchor domain-containing protein [Oscillospiraceae bacterium]